MVFSGNSFAKILIKSYSMALDKDIPTQKKVNGTLNRLYVDHSG